MLHQLENRYINMPARLTPSEISWIQHLYKSGKTTRLICQETGYAINTVRRYRPLMACCCGLASNHNGSCWWRQSFSRKEKPIVVGRPIVEDNSLLRSELVAAFLEGRMDDYGTACNELRRRLRVNDVSDPSAQN